MAKIKDRIDTIIESRETTIYWSLLSLFLCFFFYQILFVAIETIPNGPDEHRHVYISKLYYENPLTIPFEDTPEHAKLLIETPATPYLYHLVMGWVLHLNVVDIDQTIFLRIVNALLSPIFFIYLALLYKRIVKDRLTELICMGFSINIFMLPYLWGSVSYDNFTNMFAIASFYHFVKFHEDNDFQSLLLLVIAVGCGSLTKFTFLPLTLFFIVACLYHFIRVAWSKTLSLKLMLPKPSIILFMILVAAVVVTGLNVVHYGKNILTYQTPTPSAIDVRGEEGAIDLISTRNIRIKLKADKPEAKSFLNFTFSWLITNNLRTFGVTSHKMVVLKGKYLVLLNVVLAGFILGFLMKWNRWIRNGTDVLLLLCCLGYFTIVFCNNYLSYRQHHIFGIALQGRYLFPVLFPFVGLIGKYSVMDLRVSSKMLTIFFVFIFFSSLGFFYFLRHGDFLFQP